MISVRLRADIRRLFTVEGWRVNTIARHLGIHHGTVSRALDRQGLRAEPRVRPLMIEPYVGWIRQTFEQYPDLAVTTLHEMAVRRGYPGGYDHFRYCVSRLGLRPQRTPEAFLRLHTLAGEQAQVDWAYFGKRRVDGGMRKIWVFVMVLSYSRALFFRFFYNAKGSSFYAGHVAALNAFGGCPKVLLYDNLKSAVLERRGPTPRFHPKLLELADHYGFEPRPVAPRRGNEKGRVERAIRYLRTSFFPLRRDWSLEVLNEAAPVWCRTTASRRRWPQDRRRTVAQALGEERRYLLPLPGEPFPAREEKAITVRRSPYVRFDANRYSIPHDRVGRPLLLLAGIDRIRLLDGAETIAEHPRCWGKQQILEIPGHIDDHWKAKKAARQHQGQGRLIRAVPAIERLLQAVAERHRSLASAAEELGFLLDTYGAVELGRAVNEALDAGSPHPETVRLILDRRARERGQRPALPIPLPNDPRLANLHVQPHALADYDLIKEDLRNEERDPSTVGPQSPSEEPRS